MAHRIDLHNQLKATAISSDHIGRPAQLRTDSRVVDVDPETATVVLEDGSRITGDVVVGADGIHVSCESFVQQEVFNSEYSPNYVLNSLN